jgi:hypothetical protein
LEQAVHAHTVVASVVRSAQMDVDVTKDLAGVGVVDAHESKSVKVQRNDFEKWNYSRTHLRGSVQGKSALLQDEIKGAGVQGGTVSDVHRDQTSK